MVVVTILTLLSIFIQILELYLQCMACPIPPSSHGWVFSNQPHVQICTSRTCIMMTCQNVLLFFENLGVTARPTPSPLPPCIRNYSAVTERDNTHTMFVDHGMQKVLQRTQAVAPFDGTFCSVQPEAELMFVNSINTYRSPLSS